MMAFLVRCPALLVLLLGAVSPADAQNLLQNPSAEEPLDGGEIPGWTEVVGSTWTYRASNPDPYEGAAYFFPGAVANAELSQEVDISAYAEAIDAGTQGFRFEGFVRSFSQSPADQSRIVVEYRDEANGDVLGSFDSGDIVSTTGWTPVMDQRTAPVGARVARVHLIATRLNGSNIDGYFDALSLAPSACAGIAVTTAADAGPGSLRQAITDANASANPDTICFAIPGDGPHTIPLASALPAITQPVVIDGYTQAGASENTLAVGSDAVLMIEFDGSAAGDDAPGLLLTGSGITVRGLAVGDFDGDLVRIESGGENVVEGVWLGTDATGTQPREGNSGVWIVGSAANTIGGEAPAARNVIAGNTGGGIYVIGEEADGNRLMNNYIGTDPSGAVSVGSNGGGLFVWDADDTVIGAPGAGNVIAGIDGGRLFVLVGDVGPTERTVIQGNYIGTNAAGDAALGESGGGVFIEGAPNTLLGGTGEGEGNLISAGDQEDGVLIYDEVVGGITNTSAGTVVQGNLVGTDASGTAALNQCCGISVSSAHVLVGGTEPGARNVVSGNTSDGISVGDSVTVQGNYIGVDVTGTQPLGNGFGGIWISGDGNVIGGTEPGAGNVIAATGPGDGGAGIVLRFGATGNVIAGNVIGTNAEGGEGLGNDYGIRFEGTTTSGNVVGGTGEGAGNVIAHNIEAGVFFSDAGAGNAILGNSIHSNGGLGIDFFGNGPTENDPGDTDEGPNGLQNFPVLMAAGLGGVTGTLDSTPSTAFRVELFSSAEPDPSGHGEGEVYLGFADVTTDASGQAEFSFDLPPDAPPYPFVTATATAPDGSTSEFSGVTERPVSNESEASVPTAFALHAPYPNPFAGRATLRYDLPTAGLVRLVLFDVLGREVAVLEEAERPAGRHESVLESSSLPSGTYLVRMTTESGFAQTQLATLLR